MKPLSDLTVVEVGQVVSAPFAGMLFADMGADVTKVERPEVGDSQRHVTPGSHSVGDFEFLNRGKRSVELDLSSEGGREVFDRLLDGADVLVENLSPGAFDRLGMPLRSLAEDNEGLVVTSIKGFGSGPYEHRMGVDHPVEAESGMTYMTGLEGRPLRVGFSIVDVVSATYLTMGTLAIRRRLPLPAEQRLCTVGMFETAALLMGQSVAYAGVEGEAPPPLNENIFKWAVYDYFETADDETIFFGLMSDEQWERFAAEFGIEDVLDDPELQDESGRVEHRDRLQDVVREVVASHPRDEMLERLEEIRVPYAPLQTPADLLDDPHLTSGGKMTAVSRGDGNGEMSLPLPPMEGAFFDYDTGGVSSPALGEHTRECLAEAGYSGEEIERLLDEGVVAETSDHE